MHSFFFLSLCRCRPIFCFIYFSCPSFVIHIELSDWRIRRVRSRGQIGGIAQMRIEIAFNFNKIQIGIRKEKRRLLERKEWGKRDNKREIKKNAFHSEANLKWFYLQWEKFYFLKLPQRFLSNIDNILLFSIENRISAHFVAC